MKQPGIPTLQKRRSYEQVSDRTAVAAQKGGATDARDFDLICLKGTCGSFIDHASVELMVTDALSGVCSATEVSDGDRRTLCGLISVKLEGESLTNHVVGWIIPQERVVFGKYYGPPSCGNAP